MPAPDFTVDAETIEGEPKAREKVSAWLKKYVDGHEAESDFEVRLFEKGKHGDADNQLGDPFEFDPAEDSIEELIDSVIAAALEDVEEQKKRVRYAIRIDGREGEKVFTLKSTRGGVREEDDADDDLSDLDDFDIAPTAKGQVALALDQSYRFGRLFETGLTRGRKLDHEIIKDLRGEVAQLRKQQMESMRLLERAHSQVHIRDLELRKFEKSEARKDQIAGMAMQVGLPALISHLSEGKIPITALMRAAAPQPAAAPAAGPSGASPAPAAESIGGADVANARAPFDRRSGEQLDAFMRTIDPEQLAAIQSSKAFTEAQLEQLTAIFLTRIECQETMKQTRGGGG